MFHVRRMRGEGAYAKAFQASTMDPMNVTIMPTENENEDEDDEKQVQGKTRISYLTISISFMTRSL